VLPVAVDYAVTGGTATGGGVDYTLSAGSLSFAPGETSKTISASINDDTQSEPDETVVVTLNNPQNAGLGSITSLTLTIADNEPALLCTVTVSANPAAGGTAVGSGSYAPGVTVTVQANAASGYHFLNWTEGGTIISTAADYSFTATADRNLVANFEAVAPSGASYLPFIMRSYQATAG